MVKKFETSPAERELFRQAVANITSVPSKDEPQLLKYDDASKQHNSPCQQQWYFDKQGYFYSYGLHKRLLRQLTRGLLAIDATLDLHGYRIHQLTDVMELFLSKAVTNQWCLLLIIHGKGTQQGFSPIKQWLFDWLSEHPQVLAWQPATLRHGGSGAGYLLLKALP